jgi:hypothetical protein
MQSFLLFPSNSSESIEYGAADHFGFGCANDMTFI